MQLKWRRPRLLSVQVALIFAGLAVSAVLATTAIASVTVIAEENQILTREEAAESQAAALGAAVAYKSAPTYAGWRRALAPAIAVVQRTGEGLQVRDLADQVVRSSPGFASMPSPAKAAPVLVGGRLVGWAVLKFGNRGIGKIVGHFESQRWHFRLIAAGAGILLAMLLAAVVTPLVVEPVERLIAAARARGEGLMHARVGPVRGLRDMRELAATYDNMADVLDEQDQMRRNLVAYMAHEIRTPIAVIQATTEAMMDHVVKVSAEQLEPLHAEAVKLTGQVDRLQQMAVTAAASAELNFRNDNLAAIASEAATAWRAISAAPGSSWCAASKARQRDAITTGCAKSSRTCSLTPPSSPCRRPGGPANSRLQGRLHAGRQRHRPWYTAGRSSAGREPVLPQPHDLQHHRQWPWAGDCRRTRPRPRRHHDHHQPAWQGHHRNHRSPTRGQWIGRGPLRLARRSSRNRHRILRAPRADCLWPQLKHRSDVIGSLMWSVLVGFGCAAGRTA